MLLLCTLFTLIDLVYSILAMDFDNYNDDTKIEELILIGIISDYINKHITKNSCRMLIHGGELWIHDVLNGNPRQCQEQFCMPAAVFKALENWACLYTNIQNLRNHQGIPITQKLAIIIWIAGHGASNREAQEQFQHSGQTISKYVFYNL